MALCVTGAVLLIGMSAGAFLQTGFAVLALKAGTTAQDAEAAMALDMGQPFHGYQQQPQMSSMGSLPGLPALTTAQAALAGPSMGYMPGMAPSFRQASIMQQPQSMNHVLSNYMQMVQWQQVCRPQLCACLLAALCLIL